MKKSLDELLAKAKEVLGENTSDEVLGFFEDLTDSYSATSVDWEAKYKENDAAWRQKYRDRFFSDVKPEDEQEDFGFDDKPKIKTKFEELFEEV